MLLCGSFLHGVLRIRKSSRGFDSHCVSEIRALISLQAASRRNGQAYPTHYFCLRLPSYCTERLIKMNRSSWCSQWRRGENVGEVTEHANFRGPCICTELCSEYIAVDGGHELMWATMSNCVGNVAKHGVWKIEPGDWNGARSLKWSMIDSGSDAHEPIVTHHVVVAGRKYWWCISEWSQQPMHYGSERRNGWVFTAGRTWYFRGQCMFQPMGTTLSNPYQLPQLTDKWNNAASKLVHRGVCAPLEP